jgi:hypothetical protein
MKVSSIKSLLALGMVFFVFAATAQSTIKTKDLEILLTTDYTHIYSDHGTGAKMNLSIWRQKPQSGFYSLGHYAQGSYATPQAVTVMVKGLTNGAIRQPTGFKRFYTDAGTGGDQDLALWTPIAPSGYMALGLVATNGGQPNTTEVVCVRRDLVTLATAGKLIFHDGGSGGNQDLGLWRINPPSFPKDSKYAYITSGSFCGHASRATPNNSNVTYALRVLIPADEKNVKSERPQLTSMNKPAEKTDLVLTSISKLPCVSVNDAAYRGNAARQVRETPVYTLERYDYYQLQDFNTSASPNAGTMTFEMKTGMTQTHETSIEQTFGTSVTAEAGVESGIYSASISVTVSYALSQSESFSKSEMQERTAKKEFTVPAKGAGALYNLCHQYRLKRANGEIIDTWVLSTNNSHFTDFAPSRCEGDFSPYQPKYVQYMEKGGVLNAGEYLVSNNQKYRFRMIDNVAAPVIEEIQICYNTVKILRTVWTVPAFKTNWTKPQTTTFKFQEDCNFSFSTINGYFWNATNGQDANKSLLLNCSKVELTNAGKLVIIAKDGRTILWSSN